MTNSSRKRWIRKEKAAANGRPAPSLADVHEVLRPKRRVSFSFDLAVGPAGTREARKGASTTASR